MHKTYRYRASWLQESWKRMSGKTSYKVISLALAFLFFINPLAQVFANAPASSSDSATASSAPATVPAVSAGDTQAKLVGNTAIGSTIPDAPSALSDDATTAHLNFNTPKDPASAPSDAGDANQDTKSSLNSITTEPGAPPSAGVPAQPGTVKPDLSTGALVYSYPIPVPLGRNGLTPEVAFQYNSQKTDSTSIIGFGWDLPIPYICRKNSHGTDHLYDTNDYTSSQDGDLQLLQTTGSVLTFVPQSQSPDFSRYSLDTATNTWRLESKSGLVYSFGDSSASREDDPANTTHAYRWMVSSIVDSNGNTISYSYTKDQNKLYPQNIRYGVFDIGFILQPRTDIITSYASAFPVTTASRILEIQIKVSGALHKKYSCAYSVGDNGMRSLLQSITETGYDIQGSATALPPILFEYTSHQGALFTPSNAQPIPGLSAIGNSGLITGNINGDAYPDILKAYEWVYAYYTSDKNTYLFDPSTNSFQLSSSYAPPQNIMNYTDSPYNKYDGGTRILDVNGDGKGDLLRTPFDHSGAMIDKEINTGNGWSQIPNTDPTYTVNYTSNPWYTLFSEDINNDGLVDYIQTTGNASGFNTRVSMNTGSTFSALSSFAMPVYTGNNQHLMFDINGDNLPDVIESSYYLTQSPPYYYMVQHVYINNGTGWQEDPSYVLPPDFAYVVNGHFGPSNTQVIIADFNNDGLNDILSVGNCLYINRGKSFSQLSFSNTMNSIMGGNGNCNCQNPYLALDLNADGAMDFVTGGYVYYNTVTTHTDLLRRVTLSTGGTVGVAYKSSAQYKDTNNNLLNPKLPFIVETVSSVTTAESWNGVTGTTQYTYEGGFYYVNPANVFDRKFAGFQKVTAIDPAGTKTIHYFHQANSSDTALGEFDDQASKIGKVYRTEIYDSDGNLYKKSINQWDRYNLATGADLVELARTVNSVYDGDSTHRDSAESYCYNSTNGNLTQRIEYGEVAGNDDGSFDDIGNDKFTTDYDYATAASGALSKLASALTTDQSSTKVKESRYYYDSLLLGQISIGNLTKQEDWKSGTAYVNSQRTYNGYGLMVTSTDPRGKTTHYGYDSSNLYPTTITNPLNQTTQFTYDYASGQVTQKIDPNTRVFQYKYDGLGRLLEIDQPNVVTPSTLVPKTVFAYTDTSEAVSVKRSDYLDARNIADSYTYYDGLGRKIQDRKEAEGANFSVKDYAYNSRGLLDRESLPYFSTGFSKTGPTGTTMLYTTYAYDPLLRVTASTNAVGTTTNTYSGWKLTVTDPKGKAKDLYRDAYGNLIQVDEHNGTSTYITTYRYNYLGNLTKITDALSNIRNFTYDGLGRRLTAQDLHAAADATFGIWSFDYDAASNMTKRTDPNGNVVNYTYDDVNRQLTEDYVGHDGTEVTYTYDEDQDGIGHLITIASPGFIQNNTYNALGQVAVESKSIGQNGYNTSYNYDRQGNITLIIEPDLTSIQYVYNSAGLAEKVQYKQPMQTHYADIIANLDYSPIEQLTMIAYANGVTTTNTYDAAELYRLHSKVSIKGSTHLQHISYTYDPLGNITQLTDASDTSSAKTVTYTYDDLSRLIAATATSPAEGQEGFGETYNYDAIGNLTMKNGVRYSYTGSNGSNYANPHAATSIGNTALSYDRNGNLLVYGGDFGYTWDYNNRLIQVGVNLGSNIRYAYDPQGQRISQSGGSLSIIYPNKHYNIDGNGIYTKHIFVGDMSLATIQATGEVAQVGDPVPEATHYAQTDHLTGNNVITDSSGDLEELTDYYPYGNIRINEQSGSYSEQRKYTGHEFDQETGLSYMQARYYNVGTGKFLSQDPVFLVIGNNEELKEIAKQELGRYLSDPQNLNSYSYVKNNPLRFVDHDGRFWKEAGNIISFPVRVVGDPIARWQLSEIRKGNEFGAGVALGFGASATVSCALWCGSAAVLVSPTATQAIVRLTSESMRHIQEFHTLAGRALETGKSYFYSTANIPQLINLANEAEVGVQRNGNLQRIIDVGQKIGWDNVTQKATSVVTVITDTSGNVITSHPGLPATMVTTITKVIK